MKLSLISPVAASAQAWTQALTRADQTLSIHTIVKPLNQVQALVNGSAPDLVLVQAASMQDLEALERFAAAHPEIDYVLVSADLSPDVLLRAMRAGVREVLPTSASAQDVVESVQRLARKRPVSMAAPQAGRVIAVVGCKGGSGATFTAANLAHVISESGRRVALIDMNLQFGDALLFISNEHSPSNVATVARNIDRLDRDLLQSAMLQISPTLHVLAAPEDPAMAVEVQPPHVQAIIEQARQMYDTVVIDVGRSLSGVMLQALDQADRVYPVLQLTLPFIRDAKRLRDVFLSLEYPADKIHWIANRYEKNSQITLDDLRKALGLRDVLTLPNQYDVVATSVNQGLPVLQVAPHSQITRALRELAQQIQPAPATAATELAPKRGWLAGLLRPGSLARQPA